MVKEVMHSVRMASLISDSVVHKPNGVVMVEQPKNSWTWYQSVASAEPGVIWMVMSLEVLEVLNKSLSFGLKFLVCGQV
jgi:hypothetical protein